MMVASHAARLVASSSTASRVSKPTADVTSASRRRVSANVRRRRVATRAGLEDGTRAAVDASASDASPARAAMEATARGFDEASRAEADASRAVWESLERLASAFVSAFADGGKPTAAPPSTEELERAMRKLAEASPELDPAKIMESGESLARALADKNVRAEDVAALTRAAERAMADGLASSEKLFDFNFGLDGSGSSAVVALAALAAVSAASGGSGKKSGMDEWAALASKEGDVEPPELRRYDPDATRKYFASRPLTLLKRGIRSFILLGSFSAKLWLDGKLSGENVSDARRKEVNTRRATELRNLLVSLGPTYVKLGQVLSSRADLLPAEYIEELRVLQDKVPPFDDELARRILTRELGEATAKRLSLGSTPIASASLGQVYKGTWLNDEGKLEEVAVKVQRPGALVAISLDVGIIRLFAEPWRRLKNLNSDLEGLVDEWGRRFIAELDYEAEATNGENFAKAMAVRSDLGGVVTAAPVFRQASTRRVLTTGWIDGVRLQDSQENDTAQLCAVALTAYLAMLLDLGYLHADPHPGNLLRTKDGKLCILDWGLVTPVSKDLSAAILRFIAHLVSKDFEAVPGDLDAMGFIPPGKREAMEDAGVARALGLLFSALARGGGAQGFRDELGLPDEDRIKEIRKELKGVKDPKKRRDAFLEAAGTDSKVAQLTKDLEGVQEKYGNIFQIPAYFGYILRAFSVLEGIGLSSDKNYSIANECYPYVARRLLTDKSPETRKALEQLLYGTENGEHANLSVRRVKQLSSAFGSYTSITDQSGKKPAAPQTGGGESKISKSAREALKLAFDPTGGPIQDIALRELGRYAGALVSTTASSAIAAPLTAAESLAQSFGPAAELFEGARSTLAPLERATHASEEDVETMKVIEELQSLFASSENAEDSNRGSAPPAVDMELVQELIDLAPELAPGAQAAALRLGSVLFEQAAYRVARATRDD
jgi:aarF domain-containing kinase